MTHKIHKDNLGILKVIYSGRVGLNERKSAVEEACKLVSSIDHVKLLIDVRNIVMNMSISEQQKFSQYLASKNELANAKKVAVLHNYENNPNLMINAFAYSEGYVTVSFNNENDATMWLIGKLK